LPMAGIVKCAVGGLDSLKGMATARRFVGMRRLKQIRGLPWPGILRSVGKVQMLQDFAMGIRRNPNK